MACVLCYGTVLEVLPYLQTVQPFEYVNQDIFTEESHEHAPKVLWSTFTHHIIHIMGMVGTVSSQMD